MEQQIKKESVKRESVTAANILLLAFGFRIVNFLFHGLQYLLSGGVRVTVAGFFTAVSSMLCLLVAMLIVVLLTRGGSRWMKWLLLAIIVVEIYWRVFNAGIFEYDFVSLSTYLLSSILILFAVAILFTPATQKIEKQ